MSTAAVAILLTVNKNNYVFFSFFWLYIVLMLLTVFISVMELVCFIRFNKLLLNFAVL